MNPFLPLFQPPPVIRPQPSEEPPARVRVALKFLAHCTMKTMARGMVNDVGFDTIPGQSLSDEEASAQATACNLLSSFFRGRLKPSHAEHLVLDALEDQGRDSREGSPGEQPAGMLMRCFACAPNPPQPTCPFCRGQGEVVVYPKNAGG